MIQRRKFLAFAATAPAFGAAPAMSLGKIHVRKVGKVEQVFKSPGPQPNGLQATKDGLWIMDQGAGKQRPDAGADVKVAVRDIAQHRAAEDSMG